MSDLIAVAVVDLKAGPVLDWAVAKAIGWTAEKRPEHTYPAFYDGSEVKYVQCNFTPSNDWFQCGHYVIAKFNPDLMTTEQGFSAYLNNDERSEHPLISGHGATYLEAACKAIVAAKFGDAVTVPRELVEVQS